MRLQEQAASVEDDVDEQGELCAPVPELLIQEQQRILTAVEEEELWLDVVDHYYSLPLCGKSQSRQDSLYRLRATYDGITGRTFSQVSQCS